MDIYESRRRVIERLIRTRFEGNQSKFAKAAKIPPSYVTRMLKEEGQLARKRIDTEMALKIESNLSLEAGEVMSPSGERGIARQPQSDKPLDARVQELLADEELSAALAARLVEVARVAPPPLPKKLAALVQRLLRVEDISARDGAVGVAAVAANEFLKEHRRQASAQSTRKPKR